MRTTTTRPLPVPRPTVEERAHELRAPRVLLLALVLPAVAVSAPGAPVDSEPQRAALAPPDPDAQPVAPYAATV